MMGRWCSEEWLWRAGNGEDREETETDLQDINLILIDALLRLQYLITLSGLHLSQKHFPNYFPYSVPIVAFVGTDTPIFCRILVHCAALPSRRDNFLYDPSGELGVPLHSQNMNSRYRIIWSR